MSEREEFLEAENFNLTKEIHKLNKEILDLNKKFNELSYKTDENIVLKEFLVNGIDNDNYEMSQASYVCKFSNEKTRNFHFEDYNDYNINNSTIQHFELVGINIKKIQIEVQGMEIWSMINEHSSFNPQLIKHRPFKHGLLFRHAHVVIKVTADYITEFRVMERKLPDDILAKLRDKYIMVKYNDKHNIFKDGTWIPHPAALDLSKVIILS